MLDKDKVLEALRASIQNPRAGEVLIQRIEAGELDAEPAKKAKGKSE
jgi:hypothetical protein